MNNTPQITVLLFEAYMYGNNIAVIQVGFSDSSLSPFNFDDNSFWVLQQPCKKPYETNYFHNILRYFHYVNKKDICLVALKEHSVHQGYLVFNFKF